ncbi:CidA/LrgA family protein [Mangrovicella endophytica]|uniref:CidA/LrgA family protein n=1 Tax=Mangrovicella endophytica TaxID=2066697 RepID=UPI000C9DF5E9|nr:CidA/LrgA family protein [Mangrovicella endophytica]
MLNAITAIFLCQLAGEAISAATGLPLPGPVIGMALLFAILAIRGSVPSSLARVGNGLLAHLSLLFVPAGAGIMLHLSRLEGEVLPLGIVLIASTLATILVTGWTMSRFSPGQRVAEQDNAGEPRR